jgi:N-acetylglucosamine-6-phosphate deacetylase
METQLIGRSFLDGKPISLELSSGKIKSIQPITSCSENRWIGPGLVDIQVNGYGGIDYNHLQHDVLTLGQVSKSLLRVGVTSHFPTIITNSSEKIRTYVSISIRLVSELIEPYISLRRT